MLFLLNWASILDHNQRNVTNQCRIFGKQANTKILTDYLDHSIYIFFDLKRNLFLSVDIKYMLHDSIIIDQKLNILDFVIWTILPYKNISIMSIPFFLCRERDVLTYRMNKFQNTMRGKRVRQFLGVLLLLGKFKNTYTMYF